MNSLMKMCAVTTLLAGLACVSAILVAQQTGAPPKQGSGGRIVVSVNAVLVPVVVRDAQGRAVGNLKKEDFELFDKNKPQTIAGFSMQQRAGTGNPPETAEATQPGSGPSGITAPSPSNVSAPVAERFIVYLIDDFHISASDLAPIQKAASRIVSGSLAPSDLAAVVTLSGTSSGLTRDHAKLQEAIANLKPQSLSRRIASVCPNIGYYEADRIVNKHDFMARETEIENTMSCCDCAKQVAEGLVENAATESLQMGDRDVRMTLGFVSEIVRKMSAMPGQRTLVFVSPGFLTMTPDALLGKSQILDVAAQSNLTINAVDARGLYTATGDAGQQGLGSSRAELTDAQYRGYSQVMNEDVMSELAAGTGGTFFHNSNDLEGGLDRLTAAPEYVYLLEYSLQNVKSDGTYHPLKVKVNQDGLKVEARQGYFAPRGGNSKGK
jgi:VWFA-related protein